MPRTGEEPKPPWQVVPRDVRSDAERSLGRRVVRAARVYGGYAPSATFRLTLGDGSRAFFKGVWSESNEHMHRALAIEERVYRELGDRLAPYAPGFLASFRRDDWHVLLLEDVGPADVPPWTQAKTRAAAREYAAFHRRNIGSPAPDWITTEEWIEFAEMWPRVPALEGGLATAAALAGTRASEAEAWLMRHLDALATSAREIGSLPRPYTLLHLDSRGDNVRVTRGRLRLFDWNWIAVGPPEFDAAAFAQGIAADGGPEPDVFLSEYEKVQPLRRELLPSIVAGLAGYFLQAAPRPPIPGLPRVRAVQRRQLKVCLPWAARLLDLPEPAWIEAVPG